MRNIKGGLNDFQEVYPDDRLRWLTVNQITGVGPLWHSWSGSPLARRLRPLIQLPARRGDAGPEAHHPRRTISSSTQNPQRRLASGRVSCCPYRRLFRGDGRDTNARTASFLKQCHSPLALRQTISQWGAYLPSDQNTQRSQKEPGSSSPLPVPPRSACSPRSTILRLQQGRSSL
jgi:hypothetical protein